MDKLLSKPFDHGQLGWYQLTEKEWEQVKQYKKITKPSVTFFNSSFADCTRNEGLNLNIDFVLLDEPTLHIPADFQASTASGHLCETLARIHKVWVLNNEKACRIVIDAILTEVLINQKNEKLLGFCEVKNNWEGPGVIYSGDTDYMVGTSKIKSPDSMDSFLLVVEAKKEWPDSAIPQIICEAGCLLKKRLVAGKDTPVFAILTNSILFKFFVVDVNNLVYASDLMVLKRGDDGTYNSSSSLTKILRWFSWFLTSVSSIASSENLTISKVEDNLTNLRSSFGLKNPTFNKKMKI